MPTEPLSPDVQLAYDALKEGLPLLIGFGLPIISVVLLFLLIFVLRTTLRREIREGFERLTLTQPDSAFRSFAADTTLLKQSMETQEAKKKQSTLDETLIRHRQTPTRLTDLPRDLYERRRQLLEEEQRYRKEMVELLKPLPTSETVEDTGSLDKKQTISTVDRERSSAAIHGRQERVGEGISSTSQDTSVFHGGVKTKGSLGRGENVMHVASPIPPEAIEEFVDFNDPPLWGQDPKELGKVLGVRIEVLHTKPDKWLGAYAIRVCGSFAAVSAFRKAFLAHPPPGLSL